MIGSTSFESITGSFINLNMMPAWFNVISKITPNAWGLDGFAALAGGGRLSDVWGPVAALLIMGGVLFAVAAVAFQRRGLAQV